MYANPARTLDEHRQRPLFKTRDISTAKVSDIAAQSYAFCQKSKKVSIGETAVLFYFFNHAASLASQQAARSNKLEPLQAALFDAYCQEGNAIGVRMFHDIFFMLNAMASFTHPEPGQIDMIEHDYGADCGELLREICGLHGNNTWWTPAFDKSGLALKALKETKTDVDLGRWVDTLTLLLDWRQRELAYGPLWADVSRMFGKFVNGGKSLEALIDTSFTFCHCNGSFFEKGHLFEPVGNALFDVLDVQRSGQIPQMVFERKCISSPRIVELGREFAELDPSVFAARVNWGNVKKVSRDSLVFTQKYANAWNQRWGGGAAANNQPARRPPPKVFNPIDEEGYLDILDTIKRPTPGQGPVWR
jgi:hypothetical protein